MATSELARTIARLDWCEAELARILLLDISYDPDDESAIRCARRNIEHARLLLRTVPKNATADRTWTVDGESGPRSLTP